MFVNTYDFVVETSEHEEISVSLRLGVGSQIRLKKKWNEGTTETIFNAVDDIERFVDIMGEALKWKGNKNTIKNGEDLVDLMMSNDMLGMAEKQKILTAVGRASGIFSEKERKVIDKRGEKVFGSLDDDEEKN